MTDTIADDLIRSYFERWERLEEEKKTISDDLKELFAEARGNGLDTKALRAVFREQVGDQNALNEFDAICDLYRASLNRPRAGRTRSETHETTAPEQSFTPREMGGNGANAGGDDVDRSAERASSAVEVGAPNSQSAATPLPADMPETEPQVPQSVSGSPISDDDVPVFLRREVA